jgi:tetratricopeptide (TPR) repeat protein
MRITTIAALIGMVAFTAPLAAQSQGNVRVMQAMVPQGNKYVPALCELKGGNFQTSSAGVAIKTASEGGFSTDKGDRTVVDAKKYVDLLTRAIKVSGEAIAVNPQNAAAWYYLGRSALMLGDLIGADSAFTRLEKMSPPCAEEIKSYRQKAWLVLVNPSATFLQNKQFDSALAVLRDAQTIARYYPQGYYNMGATFANMSPSKPDSAIYYFKVAVEKAGNDPALAATLKSAVYNMGFLYAAMGDNANATVMYRKYLAIDPTSDEVKRALATTLRLTGNTAEAVQIENQLMAAGTLSNNEIGGVGVRLFNDKDYGGAADAFKRILVTDPYNHDALNNLANSYLALEDGKGLLDASVKLLAVDPLGKNNVKLLANAYRIAKDTTTWLNVVTQLQAMTIEVTITSFTLRKDGAKFVGTAIGSEGRNASDKIIPPAPMTLVFEFYDAKGAVVNSQEVQIAALAPNAKQEITVDAASAGILSWKYHKK